MCNNASTGCNFSPAPVNDLSEPSYSTVHLEPVSALLELTLASRNPHLTAYATILVAILDHTVLLLAKRTSSQSCQMAAHQAETQKATWFRRTRRSRDWKQWAASKRFWSIFTDWPCMVQKWEAAYSSRCKQWVKSDAKLPNVNISGREKLVGVRWKSLKITDQAHTVTHKTH